MTVERTDIDLLVSIAREASDTVILPHFANLRPAEIRTKAHASDFVTVADEAAERLIQDRIRQAYGADMFFLGEELMEREPDLITRLPEADRAIVVDPIDGTYNYANGIPAFAVIIAVVARGQVVGGVIYDPMRGDAACAIAGGGAFVTGGGRPETALRVAAPVPLSEMFGSAAWNYAEGEDRRHIVDGLARTWGTCNYRCGAQEMRLLFGGGMHYGYYHRTSPWDHAAGWLIHREAGGVGRMLDGSPYRPEKRTGGLLMATDEASWTALAEAIRNG